jgi:hypothetical protein
MSTVTENDALIMNDGILVLNFLKIHMHFSTFLIQIALFLTAKAFSSCSHTADQGTYKNE